MQMVEIKIACPFCGAEFSLYVSLNEWNAYANGALAQEAFKSLSPSLRECIISGICPDCQDSIFGKEE